MNNQVPGDRGADLTTREPAENGLIFRALEIPPDSKDTSKHIEILQELHRQVKQKYAPTEKDVERHPSMHRTDTCDLFVIAFGEVYLVTDTDETLLKAGDTAIVKGVNHAWSNTSDKPCMIIGVMVHANPWPRICTRQMVFENGLLLLPKRERLATLWQTLMERDETG